MEYIVLLTWQCTKFPVTVVLSARRQQTCPSDHSQSPPPALTDQIWWLHDLSGLRAGLTFQTDAARLVDVAGRHLVEDGVLVVDGAVEGAGLVVTTGDQAGQSLETVSVSQTGQALTATLSHHAHQVRAGRPLRWTEILNISSSDQRSAAPQQQTSRKVFKTFLWDCSR